MGFGKKEKSGFSIHRSEEVVPHTLRHLVRQSSSLSSNEGWGDDDQPAGRTETGARALLLSTSLNASSSSGGPSSPRRAGFQIGPPSVESSDERDKDGYAFISARHDRAASAIARRPPTRGDEFTSAVRFFYCI